MRKIIAVRFDGVLGPTASSIIPGKVYPLATPRDDADSYGHIRLGDIWITVVFHTGSAHLGGKLWTLIYESIGTIIISNDNHPEFLRGLKIGNEYEIDRITGDGVEFKDDDDDERNIHIVNSQVNFCIVINNQVINNKKYGDTGHQRA